MLIINRPASVGPPVIGPVKDELEIKGSLTLALTQGNADAREGSGYQNWKYLIGRRAVSSLPCPIDQHQVIRRWVLVFDNSFQFGVRKQPRAAPQQIQLDQAGLTLQYLLLFLQIGT